MQWLNLQRATAFATVTVIVMPLLMSPLACVAQEAETAANDPAVVLEDSFEEGQGAPTGWREGAAIDGVTYTWAEGVASDGQRSLALQKTANRYFPIAEWSRTVPHRGDAASLEVSALVRAKQDSKAILDVAFLGSGDRPRGHQWIAYIGSKEEGEPPSHHDWGRYAGVVRIPPGTKKLAFGLQIYGPGSVWFDELEARYLSGPTDNGAAAKVGSNTAPSDSLASAGAAPSAPVKGAIEIEVKDGALGKYLLVPPAAEPAGLVVVLPGGDGSADFHPFVKNIAERALQGKYAVAQPIAPQWRDSRPITWPTLRGRTPGMKYATEELVGKVMADVFRKHRIDRRKIYLLAWSSGGPAAYAIALHPQSPVSGSLVAMSVFKPDDLPPVKNAAQRRFYLLHSPEDQVCPYWMAQEAEKALSGANARATLVNYDGGHGWHGDVFGNIKAGFDWLEQNN